MIRLKEALIKGIASLTSSSPTPRIDAELLLCHVLKKTLAFLYAHPEQALDQITVNTYQSLLTSRTKGTPIAYLTEAREFWSLSLKVSADTLIPRPETELLVETTLGLTSELQVANVLELGTGSGAIALALAHSRPQWHITAWDKSLAALNIAIQNANQLQINNVTFHERDWFKSLPWPIVDIIVSNPPYIAENDPHLSQGDLRFEPQEALVSGKNGLESLHFMIKHGYNHLHSNGVLLVEHGYDQQIAVTNLFEQYNYSDITTYQDWQGLDRVVAGKKGV